LNLRWLAWERAYQAAEKRKIIFSHSLLGVLQWISSRKTDGKTKTTQERHAGPAEAKA
jgi:hypothetical protein